MNISEYLLSLKVQLLAPTNIQKVTMTRSWAATIPKKPGVYVLRDGDNIVYVGETGSLGSRMSDLLDSRNHTVRRTIGKRFYSELPGYIAATTSDKFPEHIEQLVNHHICTRLSLAYLVVELGRKELEELIEGDIEKVVKLNIRGKRIVKSASSL